MTSAVKGKKSIHVHFYPAGRVFEVANFQTLLYMDQAMVFVVDNQKLKLYKMRFTPI